MRWSDIWLKFWVYSEAEPEKRLTLAQVKRMEEIDLDYMCILRSAKHGLEITRDDLEGERFQLYCPPSPTDQPLCRVWAKFEDLKVKHTGASERTWTFPASRLDEIANKAGIRKLNRQRAKHLQKFTYTPLKQRQGENFDA